MYKIQLIIILICSLTNAALSKSNNVCDKILAGVYKNVFDGDNKSDIRECSALEFITVKGVIVAEFVIDSTSDNDVVSLVIFEGDEEDSFVYKIDMGPLDPKFRNGSHTIKVKINHTGSLGQAALVGQVSRDSSIKINLVRFETDSHVFEEEVKENIAESNIHLYNLTQVLSESIDYKETSFLTTENNDAPMAIYPFAVIRDITNEDSTSNDAETNIDTTEMDIENLTATETVNVDPTTIVTVPFPTVTQFPTVQPTTPIVTIPFPTVTQFPTVQPTTPIVTVPFPTVTQFPTVVPTTPIVTIPFPTVTQFPTVSESVTETDTTTEYSTTENIDSTTPSDEEPEGLSVFIVVIIALSSVLAAVLLSFSIYWFLLSGKSLDLKTPTEGNREIRRQTSTPRGNLSAV